MSPNFDQTLFAKLYSGGFTTPLQYFPTIDSTNSEVRRRPAQLGHGTVLVADYQAAGKGRRGRTWIAPPYSSLLVTLVLKPQIAAENAGWIPMLTSLAAARAVAQLSDLQPAIKWPNDLMLADESGDWRKFGGLLIESQQQSARTTFIIGMGINVNLAVDELPDTATPATSMLIATGKRFVRERLLALWLQEVEARVAAAERGVSPYADWHALLLLPSRPVTVRGAETTVGTIEGADPYGRLLLRDGDGKLHHFAAGDVTLRSA